MTPGVQGDKIILARESRSLTQGELALRLGISQGQISKIELGMLRAPEELVPKLAKALDYQPSLFYSTEPVYGAGPNDLYHRKRQSTSSRLMKKIYAHINLRRIQIARLLKSVSLSCHVPRFPLDEHPDGETAIAEMVRALWHLPGGPIPSLTGLLERAGAIIVPCNFETPLVDAISQWLPGHPPMFFVNRMLARSRWRMTLAHELAHVVMHATPNPEMENQAARFASSLLMPEADIESDFRVLARCRTADDCLSKLAELKLVWQVSIQGLLVRASELGALPARMVTSAWKRIAQLGYRKNEPLEHRLPAEQPTTLSELVTKHLRGLGYSTSELAEALSLNVGEFRQLYLPQEVGHLRAV